MKEIKIEIPGEVLCISNPYSHKGYRTYMIKSAKTFKEKISYYVKSFALNNHLEPLKFNNIQLKIIAYFSDRKRRDVFNLCKIIPDSLEGILYENDSQVVRSIQEKYYDKSNPRLILELKEVDREY